MMLMRQTSNQAHVEIEKAIKKRSFYFKTGMVAIGYSIFACMISFIFGDIGEFISFEWIDWFLPLVTIPAFIGSHISGATYVGREADLLSKEETRFSNEQWGTLLGITFGFVVAISLIIVGTLLIAAAASSLLAGDISGILNILEIFAIVISSVASFAGLGNRLGSAIQKSRGETVLECLSSVIVQEKKPLLMGAALGFLFSLTLWMLGAAAMTSVTAISFMSFGFPLWITGALFILSYTGCCASSFDYFTRASNYIKATFMDNPNAQQAIKGKYAQQKGATLGVIIGAIIAIAIIIKLFVTQPYLIAAVAAIGVFFTCTGIWGGIFSRMGKILFDEPTPVAKPTLESIEVVEPKPRPTPVPAPIPEKVPIEAKEKPSPQRTSTPNILSAFAEQEETQENMEFFTADKQRDDDSISALLNSNCNLSLINNCRFDSTNTSENNFSEGIALEA